MNARESTKLVLIDGFAVLHRAYHALPPLTTKNGEPINAVYGLISILLRLVQDFKPTYIAVTFDRTEPTFRHIEFASYQGQRPKLDDEFSSQLEKTDRVLEAFGIPVYSMAGFEADDVIGTLADKAAKAEAVEEVIIVTGDRDILQLVNDKVKVYLPVRGLSEGKLFGEDDVVEKMGVKPKQIPDLKAFVGDSSDNYPGVPGIGPKTAITLLKEYGGFDKVYKNLAKLPERLKIKLTEGRKSGEQCFRLAKISQEVAVDLDLDAMAGWKIDGDNVLTLFSEFGFKTLTNRVKEVGKELAKENQLSIL